MIPSEHKKASINDIIFRNLAASHIKNKTKTMIWIKKNAYILTTINKLCYICAQKY